MKRLSKLIAEAQSAMIEQLYMIAQPHLNYPRNMWNAWLYPVVHVWEPFTGDPIDAITARLVGQYIVPSTVVFPILPDDPPSSTDVRKLDRDLTRHSGDQWKVFSEDMLSNGIIAVRLSQQVVLHSEDGRKAHFFYLPFDFVVPEGVRYEDVISEPETPAGYPAEQGT